MTRDAPPPLACETADDCVAGGVVLAATCCMSGVTHPHSADYHAWQMAQFSARCGGTCMHPPSPPLPCEIALRCEANRCANSCGVTLSDGALDAMDRTELEAACISGSTAACDRLGH